MKFWLVFGSNSSLVNSFQRNCRSLRIPFFAEKMGTLDDDMAQEGDIAELQENFNENVEHNIRMDHIEQEIEELSENMKKGLEREKKMKKRERDINKRLKKNLEELNRPKKVKELLSLCPFEKLHCPILLETLLDSLRPRTTRLDSLRPRTTRLDSLRPRKTPKKYKF